MTSPKPTPAEPHMLLILLRIMQEKIAAATAVVDARTAACEYVDPAYLHTLSVMAYMLEAALDPVTSDRKTTELIAWARSLPRSPVGTS
jgi:hypothetical protein